MCPPQENNKQAALLNAVAAFCALQQLRAGDAPTSLADAAASEALMSACCSLLAAAARADAAPWRLRKGLPDTPGRPAGLPQRPASRFAVPCQFFQRVMHAAMACTASTG